jgi:hypothetical protein
VEPDSVAQNAPSRVRVVEMNLIDLAGHEGHASMGDPRPGRQAIAPADRTAHWLAHAAKIARSAGASRRKHEVWEDGAASLAPRPDPGVGEDPLRHPPAASAGGLQVPPRAADEGRVRGAARDGAVVPRGQDHAGREGRHDGDRLLLGLRLRVRDRCLPGQCPLPARPPPLAERRHRDQDGGEVDAARRCGSPRPVERLEPRRSSRPSPQPGGWPGRSSRTSGSTTRTPSQQGTTCRPRSPRGGRSSTAASPPISTRSSRRRSRGSRRRPLREPTPACPRWRCPWRRTSAKGSSPSPRLGQAGTGGQLGEGDSA